VRVRDAAAAKPASPEPPASAHLRGGLTRPAFARTLRVGDEVARAPTGNTAVVCLAEQGGGGVPAPRRRLERPVAGAPESRETDALKGDTHSGLVRHVYVRLWDVDNFSLP
jgi:hypothetical protein